MVSTANLTNVCYGSSGNKSAQRELCLKHPLSMTLFHQKFATHDSVLDFDYKHSHAVMGDDRKWVKVSVHLNDMKLDYQNVSGERTGPHGEVAERNHFSEKSHLELRGHEHQILFRDFHSPHGYEQNMLFIQVRPLHYARASGKAISLPTYS